jgi:hypothetical protein
LYSTQVPESPISQGHHLCLRREPNNPELKGLLKVGYTSRTIDERMHEHYPTLKPGEKPYEVVFVEPAMRTDGTTFMDHEVHANLERERLQAPAGTATGRRPSGSAAPSTT